MISNKLHNTSNLFSRCTSQSCSMLVVSSHNESAFMTLDDCSSQDDNNIAVIRFSLIIQSPESHTGDEEESMMTVPYTKPVSFVPNLPKASSSCSYSLFSYVRRAPNHRPTLVDAWYRLPDPEVSKSHARGSVPPCLGCMIESCVSNGWPYNLRSDRWRDTRGEPWNHRPTPDNI